VPALGALLAWGRSYAVAADDPDRDRYRTVRRRSSGTPKPVPTSQETT
jgi:hypothetical protein